MARELPAHRAGPVPPVRDGRPVLVWVCRPYRRVQTATWLYANPGAESRWAAASEAIAGELTGRRLKPIPAPTPSWADFKPAFPTGRVLLTAAGYRQPYGRDPNLGKDNPAARPFLQARRATLLPMTRGLTVELDGKAVAYPHDCWKGSGLSTTPSAALARPRPGPMPSATGPRFRRARISIGWYNWRVKSEINSEEAAMVIRPLEPEAAPF